MPVQKRTSGRRNQRGLTLVEYAAAGGVVIIVTILAFIALGGAVGGQITRVATAVDSANPR